MSSGFGFSGTGRCYPIWRDYALCKDGSSDPIECQPFFDDYITCNYGWADPKNLEVMRRQLAVSKEQKKWESQYGKKMAAHVRKFKTEGECEEWKAKRVIISETPATMEDLRNFTKEKLNPQQ